MMLSTSEKIDELAASLAKAQGSFPKVSKERTAKIESAKGGYSYSYADLSDILDAIRKPLSDNGLSIIQPVCTLGDGSQLVTRLLHASGQWIESTYPLEVYERPQETGSAITYARRYALTALLGIAAEEDDDGAGAQNATPRPRQQSTGKACPVCGESKAVIKGREEYGGGWVCYAKKGGCGHKWHDGESIRESTEAASKSVEEALGPATCPHPDCGGTDIGTGSDGRAFCRKCRRGI